MGLAEVPMPTEIIPIGGAKFEVSGLSLRKVRQLEKMPPDESDVQAIAWGCDVTLEEAEAWIESSPGGAAAELMAAILRLSGWDEGARKSAAT